MAEKVGGDCWVSQGEGALGALSLEPKLGWCSVVKGVRASVSKNDPESPEGMRRRFRAALSSSLLKLILLVK